MVENACQPPRQQSSWQGNRVLYARLAMLGKWRVKNLRAPPQRFIKVAFTAP